MSYDLEALPALVGAAPTREQLAARAGAFLSLRVYVGNERFAVNGSGFSVESTPRGYRLSSASGRTDDDERAMEVCALILAGDAGAVLDRHTGRSFPRALLADWLEVAGLFSGRALAVNEERLARRGEHGALAGFTARAEALSRAAASDGFAPALRARVHDELAHYATRPALVWPCARALARVGDFERLELLARAPADDPAHDAFAVAAEFAPTSLELFARALGDPDPNHRRAAARALHLVPTPDVLPLVLRALDDKRATVREAVLESDFERVLALPGASAVLAPALARLATDSSSLVRKLRERWVR